MEHIRLGAILLEGGIVDEAGLERCLAIQALTGGSRPLGQILVEQGLITAPELERILDLQRTRVAARNADVADTDVGCASLLAAAQAQNATEIVVSEGRPVRMRVACEWRRLTNEVLRGPEVWEFVRELMGPEVLEELAERQFVVHAWNRGALGRGSATAFRQFDGVAVRVTFAAATAPTAEAAGLPSAFLETLRAGKGLILVVGERGVGRADTLAPLVQLVARDPDHYVVVVDDEPMPLPTEGSLVVRRRYGISPQARAATLRNVVREDPDTLVVADVGTPETFELALRAAEGGRLVIAYLDASSASAALVRALNFYPGYDLPRVRATLAAVLRAVFVRHLLPDVRREGTVAATELLLVDDAVREVVRGGELADLGLLIRADGSRCGHSLDRNMLELLVAGRARLEDVFARAEEKAWLLERTKELQIDPR
ncbi:MAG: Flp pilus assembly complex ATPase component TadA [Planctomycetes bacterium]|nr:Flp pilus assembly complex ATPase component TadA [Planctomycetota bacterium]